MAIVGLFFFLLEGGVRIYRYSRDGNLWALLYGIPSTVLAYGRGVLAYLETSPGETGEPLRILAFGGSTTKGAGLARGPFSYPGRLQGLLHARYPNLSLTVKNYGEDGAYAKLIAKWVREVLFGRDVSFKRGRQFPPLVIIYTGLNDAFKITMRTRPEYHPTWPQRIDGFLRNRSLFYLILYEKWVRIAPKGRKEPESPAVREVPMTAEFILGQYQKSLEEIARVLRASGVKGLFGKIPIFERDVPAAYLKAYRLVFDKLEEVGRKVGIPVVDVAAEFSKFPDKAGLFLPRDPFHLNAEGNGRVAEILHQAIQKHGLLPLRRQSAFPPAPPREPVPVRPNGVENGRVKGR